MNVHYGDVLIKYGSILDVESDEIPYIAAGKESKKQCYLSDGDVIIADTAEDKTVGKCAEITNTKNAKIEAGLHTIPCHPRTAYAPMFLGYYMNSPYYHKQLIPLMQGVKVLSVSKSNIGNTLISAPTSYSEQEKIVELLHLLDCRMRKQQEVIDNLKKYKRGVICKVFSEIEHENNMIRFGDCVSIFRGGSPRPIDDYITDDPSGINWIKIGDTSEDELYITRTKEKIISAGAKKSRRVYQGDLILSNSMSFGRPYILQIAGCIHDGWLLIRDEKNIFDKRFLCYYLGSDNVIAQYKRFAAGSCVNNLNSELVGNVKICCPPRAVQQKIADMLSILDLRIDHAIHTCEAFQRMRTSLLQQLFM